MVNIDCFEQDAYSDENDHPLRFKPDTHSDSKRTLIPVKPYPHYGKNRSFSHLFAILQIPMKLTGHLIIGKEGSGSSGFLVKIVDNFD